MKRIFLMMLVVLMVLAIVPFGAVSADNETETELPASTTLVGTKHLPPISNQGNIGTCASSSMMWATLFQPKPTKRG